MKALLIGSIVILFIAFVLLTALVMLGAYAMYQSSLWFDER